MVSALSGSLTGVALIEIDARPLAVLLDCAGCGGANALTLKQELADPDKLAREHSRATGHKCRIIEQGSSYLTLVIGPSRQASGPMPLIGVPLTWPMAPPRNIPGPRFA